jgi:cysteine dioxygenase
LTEPRTEEYKGDSLLTEALNNLATHFETTINTDLSLTTEACSFTRLVEILIALQQQPSLGQINSWLEHVHIAADELQPFVSFKNGNYWRHRVCRNEFVEMLVLCWRPGHRTPIHDHNGSHGAVKVHEGILWETSFHYDAEKGLCYRTARECLPGEVTGADVPAIHQLGNPDVSERDLVTIHIYSPPLGVLKTYKVGSREVDTYTPNDADV